MNVLHSRDLDLEAVTWSFRKICLPYSDSAQHISRCPIFDEGVMTPPLVPGGQDVQHMLDPSSMSVSFSLFFLSRLEQRWKELQSVISIVNYSIQWTNWRLNACCSSGYSWKQRTITENIFWLGQYLLHYSVRFRNTCTCTCCTCTCTRACTCTLALTTPQLHDTLLFLSSLFSPGSLSLKPKAAWLLRALFHSPMWPFTRFWFVHRGRTRFAWEKTEVL